MERRAFLRGLLLAPIAAPVAAKAMAAQPLCIANNFTVVTNAVGGVVGCRLTEPLSIFTVASIDGKPHIAVRGDLVSDLNEIATEQNARLA